MKNKVTLLLIIHSLKAEGGRKTGSIYGLEGKRKMPNLAEVVLKVKRSDEDFKTIVEVVKNRPNGTKIKILYEVNPAINEFKVRIRN